MYMQNERTGKDQAVVFGDILYAQLDEKTGLDKPKTWSFRCQGFVVKPDGNYILGPGDTAFRLGWDCFTTAREARDFGNKADRNKLKLVEMTKEERIKV